MLKVEANLPEPIKELLEAGRGTITGEQILNALGTNNPVPTLYDGFQYGHMETMLGKSDPTKTSAAQLSRLFDWALDGLRSSLINQNYPDDTGFYGILKLVSTAIHLRGLEYQPSTPINGSFAELSAPSKNA